MTDMTHEDAEDGADRVPGPNTPRGYVVEAEVEAFVAVGRPAGRGADHVWQRVSIPVGTEIVIWPRVGRGVSMVVSRHPEGFIPAVDGRAGGLVVPAGDRSVPISFDPARGSDPDDVPMGGLREIPSTPELAGRYWMMYPLPLERHPRDAPLVLERDGGRGIDPEREL